MDDLTTWLRAQIDEDERIARIIEPGGGHQPVRWTSKPASSGTWTHVVAEVRFVDDPPEIHEDYVVALVRDGRAEWAHIVRHDPARVLREVEAKRLLLDGHEPVKGVVNYLEPTVEPIYGTVCGACGSEESPEAWPCRHVRLLALPYADRPDYREEWRP